MSDILVKPPQLREIAANLQSRAKRVESACNQVDQTLASLKGKNFLGQRAEIMQNRYQALRDSLLNYHRLVVGFANQLEQVALLFEKADSQVAGMGDPANPLPDPAKTLPIIAPLPAPDSFYTTIRLDDKPQNMRDLAKLVTNYETSTPIQVVEIGKNEYLILVTGTQGGDKSNNWNSAIISGLGFESDYQHQLKGILMGLPAGAVVNMVGHSQGGIVSNNLAADPEVNSHLTVQSVTTFGSPVSALPKEGVIYRRYAVLGDPVPTLGYKGIEEVVDTIENPLKWSSAGELGSTVGQTIIPGRVKNLSWDPIEDIGGAIKDLHMAYTDEDSPLSQVTNLPFTIKQWDYSEGYRPNFSSANIPIVDMPL